MYYLDLSGEWECQPRGKQAMRVQVPGCFDTYMEEKDFAQEVRFSTKFTAEENCEHYRLCFGAVSYYCDVFLNGVQIGSHEGMWDRFYIDPTPAIRPGENLLEVVVTKPGYHDTDAFPLRQVLTGFLPDVICTFGGLWEKPALLGAPAFFVQNYFARGNAQGGCDAEVQLWAAETGEYRLQGRLLDSEGREVAEISSPAATLQPGCHCLRAECSIENPRLWSLDDPALYSLEITVLGPGQAETLGKAFGFRDIGSQGSTILLNNRPVYPRGVLHWGYYDEIIIPRPSREAIREEILRCKAHGFNMIKHCLYIPSEEYFELADELGMLLWIELPLWLPDPTPQLEQRIRREYPAIVKQISGHPSVVVMSLGCELNDAVDTGILEEMYHLVKQESGALVRDNSGSGECYGGHTVDFADFFDYHFYGELQNMENLMEVFTPGWRNRRPWMYGEFCDSDTLRDLERLRKSRGVDTLWWEQDNHTTNPISLLKPDFYAGRHDECMEKAGIRQEFDSLLPLSLQHSLLHRKVTLEQTRAFPEISGYMITSIRDVPIATSGIFDDNMKEKFNPAQFAAFNGDVALLPAFDLGRVWIGADRVASRERYNYVGGTEFGLHVLLSNYSAAPVEGAQFSWQLVDSEGLVKTEGAETVHSCHPCGSVEEIYYLVFPLPEVEHPQSFSLKVTLTWPGGRVGNEWPLFLYPEQQPEEQAPLVYDPCNLFAGLESIFPKVEYLTDGDEEQLNPGRVVFTSLWTPSLQKFAKNGGRVLCVQRGKGPLPTRPMPFWREGMLRPCPHPVLEHCADGTPQQDLRYFSLATDSALDEAEMQAMGFASKAPILLRYDCRLWERHSYLGEFTFGEGRVIATTLRLEGGMGKQPLTLAKSPFARQLVRNIFRYLRSL